MKIVNEKGRSSDTRIMTTDGVDITSQFQATHIEINIAADTFVEAKIETSMNRVEIEANIVDIMAADGYELKFVRKDGEATGADPVETENHVTHRLDGRISLSQIMTSTPCTWARPVPGYTTTECYVCGLNIPRRLRGHDECPVWKLMEENRIMKEREDNATKAVTTVNTQNTIPDPWGSARRQP